MTRRPANVSPEIWHDTFLGAAERLQRAILRPYCTAMPRGYRRRFLWLPAHLGMVGLIIAVATGWTLRFLIAWAGREG